MFEINREQFSDMIKYIVEVKLIFKDVNNEDREIESISVVQYPPIGATLNLLHYYTDKKQRRQVTQSFFKVKDIEIDYACLDINDKYDVIVYVEEIK
jgi:hypothetical protein